MSDTSRQAVSAAINEVSQSQGGTERGSRSFGPDNAIGGRAAADMCGADQQSRNMQDDDGPSLFSDYNHWD